MSDNHLNLPTDPFADISPQAAAALLKVKDTQLIDTRTESEYRHSRLARAALLDVYDPQFYERLAQLPREPRYVVYCHTGGRSGFAVDLMRRLGFRAAHNVVGGIKAWEQLGLPLEYGQPSSSE